MFLPKAPFETVERDFQLFYSNDVKLAGESIRPTLEQHVFAFLDQEIDVSGSWNVAAMKVLFENRLEAANKSESALAATVRTANAPDKAAHNFLVQLAGDFLTEASAMARNVLGNFGAPLSELFKVLIDEYGYGVHQTKHSTIYEELLESQGLSSEIHAYWQFYLTSSLALTNYFHYVSRNHGHFFRYLGALYYTEATIPHANRQFSRLLRELFGKDTNTNYFDEHVHIDPHHARMALEKVIEPVIERCGESVIPEIVRGFEAFRLLQDIADEELIDQITWSDTTEDYCQKAKDLLSDPERPSVGQTLTFTETKGELSVTHVHDEDELFVVSEGEIELITGFDQSVKLSAGEGIVIPKGRLHGSVVLSDTCSYWVS
ncbi:MAG: iron-containing redox enzyme family protein, partial [Pirellulaceae bacterium]|nr:iron-containing redox enzyme family protein [Pirellulaceae bacterium]